MNSSDLSAPKPSKSGISAALLSLYRHSQAADPHSFSSPDFNVLVNTSASLPIIPVDTAAPSSINPLDTSASLPIIPVDTATPSSINPLDSSASVATSNDTLTPDQSLHQSLETLIGKLGLPSRKPVAKTRVPDAFDGANPRLLSNFIFQCSMYIAACASDFPDDESRVTFTLSYLTDTPLDWFRTEMNHYLSQGTLPHWFTSYPTFLSDLRRLFGPVDPASDAMSALEALHYTDSAKATGYTLAFNTHAILTGWNDQALSHRYYQGLSNRLKDEIARVGKPAGLRPLQDLVAALDQRYWERQSEFCPESPPTIVASLPTSTSTPASPVSSLPSSPILEDNRPEIDSSSEDETFPVSADEPAASRASSPASDLSV
jgi:hypothetical protein